MTIAKADERSIAAARADHSKTPTLAPSQEAGIGLVMLAPVSFAITLLVIIWMQS